MVTGWRRAFCTSIPKQQQPEEADKKQPSNTTTTANSPRISSKFGFFSNPSTPRLQPQPPLSNLRCKTTATPPQSSLPNSPKLQCKKSNSPRVLFNFSSNPSSPKSPSTTTFSFLKATLRLSKSKCGICMQSVKTGQGTAIFTAECGHVFHFPCITSHRKNKNQEHLLICPVCNANWKELPLISSNQEIKKQNQENFLHVDVAASNKIKNLRVYNDDEPLLSPSPGSLFNSIPENDVAEDGVGNENDSSITAQEFQGFFVNPAQVIEAKRNLEFTLLPESAVVTAGRGYQTHVVVLRVRAPPSTTARRPPIDLVTVLDVSERMGSVMLQRMKRVMRVIISSLNSYDRLSVVAFSANSKRLLPLRRMTADGRRSARRLVDALGTTSQGMSANDALKKAAKVIEDRRVKNPVSSIIIISNGQDDRSHMNSFNHKRSSMMAVSSTRFSHLGIPVHSISLENTSALSHALHEDSIAKFVTGLLKVSVQDVKLQVGFGSSGSVSAVYSLTSRAVAFSPGSIRLGDLHGEEERELLVELKVDVASVRSRHVLTVRSSFKDPSSQELILSKEQVLSLPRPQAVRSSSPNIQRLRDLHVSTRAAAESRRLIDNNDLSGAHHLLSSARALLMQSSDGSANVHVRSLEAELGELHRKRQLMAQSQRQMSGQGQQVEEKLEPLTPTSAWRAAERLAKVAIMRKHMNRVSDLHGFENARF
ncbi:E3 ubiquitin-protein ligase WAVH1 [Mercurialis annua]|uniref:E3 ubiquitin-protein ligase WAVH1 n=1 Tax=Mercurialis annua TaxID=3986 RepID=UPI00215F5623|nr:E3 ubiquitin-protein ligase WAVH1 [Mercurialis annua]